MVSRELLEHRIVIRNLQSPRCKTLAVSSRLAHMRMANMAHLSCQLEGCERRLDSHSACLDELTAESVIAAMEQALG